MMSKGETNMKKFVALMLVLMLALGMTGCSSKAEDPGPPPENVIHPDNNA